MGKNSKIEWTDHTLNPWIGCSKVSDGCTNCYAEQLMDKRLGCVKWGPNGTRVRTSEKYWQQPHRWDAEAKASGKQVKVFCGSLCDIFEERPELVQWRFELWDLIDSTPNLTWMLLTKRPGEVLGLIPVAWEEEGWPTHVWMGVSVCNQAEADKNIPHLLSIPASVRFVSAEPLIAPIDFSQSYLAYLKALISNNEVPPSFDDPNPLSLIIIGGESGPNARPMMVNWAQDIVDQCHDAGVPVFVKQLGSWAAKFSHLRDKKGAAMDEWPESLRVREYPNTK